MSEVKRWEIKCFPPMAGSGRETAIVGPVLRDGDRILVREDQATETERERIETWLEERYGGPVRDHIGEWGGHEEWGADARELLDMLFGEEASRG